MKTQKVNNKLYVLDDVADVITKAEDVDIIFVPFDSYNEYINLNDSIKDYIKPFNYSIIRVTVPEFVGLTKGKCPMFFEVCKVNGWTDNEEYMTLDECNAVTDAMFSTASKTALFKKCDVIDLSNFNGLTTIPKGCFNNNRNIQYIYLPKTLTTLDGVKNISNGTFNNSSLRKIVIPNSVNYISDYCFRLNDCLHSADVGSGITRAGLTTFARCTNLEEITFRATTPPAIDAGYFTGTPIKHIYVPAESVEAYRTAANWSNFADIITKI